MKILIILPNWLGDALMATPAIEVLSNTYPDAKFTFIGSAVSIEALKYHPKCEAYYIDKTKQKGSRVVNTYKFAKKLGLFDMAVSFRNQPHVSLFLKFIKARISCTRSAWHSKILLDKTLKVSTDKHLVLQYKDIATCSNNTDAPPLKLYIKKYNFKHPTLGINAGATYGSAKRWLPKRFAQVAAYFSSRFDIVIFGSKNEENTAIEIVDELKRLHVNNYTNLAGKTDIKELCSFVGGCSFFITNDSGPMHIASAYQVPTVSIFGPTRFTETSQWKNSKSKLVRHDLKCSPCMRRECPLKHHDCMNTIMTDEVIQAAKAIT